MTTTQAVDIQIIKFFSSDICGHGSHVYENINFCIIRTWNEAEIIIYFEIQHGQGSFRNMYKYLVAMLNVI